MLNYDQKHSLFTVNLDSRFPEKLLTLSALQAKTENFKGGIDQDQTVKIVQSSPMSSAC